MPVTVGSPGQAIKWCQSNFNRTDPGCHGNEIWYKTGYNFHSFIHLFRSYRKYRGAACA